MASQIKKTHFVKVYKSAQKPGGMLLFRPRCPLWGPLLAILDFDGSHRRNDGIKKTKVMQALQRYKFQGIVNK